MLLCQQMQKIRAVFNTPRSKFYKYSGLDGLHCTHVYDLMICLCLAKRMLRVSGTSESIFAFYVDLRQVSESQIRSKPGCGSQEHISRAMSFYSYIGIKDFVSQKLYEYRNSIQYCPTLSESMQHPMPTCCTFLFQANKQGAGLCPRWSWEYAWSVLLGSSDMRGKLGWFWDVLNMPSKV